MLPEEEKADEAAKEEAKKNGDLPPELDPSQAAAEEKKA